MVSIIIPTYNTALLIERAIGSVIAQTSSEEKEIIIVDDGSLDDTVNIVKAMNLPDVRIFTQPFNQGPAAARNRGLREARGEFFAFLDGDDYWNPHFLEKTLAFMRAHPEAVAVSVGQIHKVIGNKDSVLPEVLRQPHEPMEPCLLPDFFAFWAKHNHVCTGAVLMRTATATAAGGQREDMRVYEDFEFWALLATYGPWGFIPEVLFVSDGGAITLHYGHRQKNRLRLKNTKNIHEWGSRVFPRLTKSQIVTLGPVLNRITIPNTYSMLYQGQFQQAYRNISDYISEPGCFPPVVVKAAGYGPIGWYMFGVMYRFYKMMKNFKNRI